MIRHIIILLVPVNETGVKRHRQSKGDDYVQGIGCIIVLLTYNHKNAWDAWAYNNHHVESYVIRSPWYFNYAHILHIYRGVYPWWATSVCLLLNNKVAITGKSINREFARV